MKEFPILLVEDDENDVFFFKRAFQKNEIIHPLHVVKDGQEAIDYLGGNGRFSNREQNPIPGLIILDLNLPRRNGLEVLRSLRAEPETHNTPVLVLTSSAADQDIDEAYDLGANSYLLKPGNPDRMVELLGAIKIYWMTFNKVPGKRPQRLL